MTIKLYQVQSLLSTLEKFSTLELPISVAYKLSKIKLAIQPDADFYITEVRKILQKYGDKDEEGNIKTDNNGNFLLLPEYVNSANEKMKELEQTDSTNIDITFSISDFGNINVKPSDLQNLLPFIKE